MCPSNATYEISSCEDMRQLWQYIYLMRNSDIFIDLQYCSESIVSLCCGLNCLSSVSNNLLTVLHVSCSDAINVCINCSSTLPSLFPVVTLFCVIYLIALR